MHQPHKLWKWENLFFFYKKKEHQAVYGVQTLNLTEMHLACVRWLLPLSRQKALEVSINIAWFITL